MKTQEEIKQLAEDFSDDAHGSPTATFLEKGFINGYMQCQEDMADKKYTEEDLRQAFRAGDKYRLYLDKWAIGIATKGLPDVTLIHTTMSENAFINSLNKQD